MIQPLEVGDETLDISVVSMGNPHAVQVVADVDHAPVGTHGPLIETHPRFPQRVNAGFMQVVDRHAIRLRVYERGAGETLACGTGACAAVVAGIRRGLLDSPVRVTTRGGDLTIAWAGQGQPVLMTGPAVTVFTGEIDLLSSRHDRRRSRRVPARPTRNSSSSTPICWRRLYIPHPHGGRAISITERQMLTLRDKNKQLESKLAELIALRRGERRHQRQGASTRASP